MHNEKYIRLNDLKHLLDRASAAESRRLKENQNNRKNVLADSDRN